MERYWPRSPSHRTRQPRRRSGPEGRRGKPLNRRMLISIDGPDRRAISGPIRTAALVAAEVGTYL